MKKILVYMSLFVILVGIRLAMGTDGAITTVGNADIRAQVEAYIEAHEAPPIEPRLDSVWQFVPGLQGLEFDDELSYQNMLTNGVFDPELMIARPIPYSGSAEDFRQHRLYKGNEYSSNVGLLINVAWGGEELREMLDILDEYNVQASIFFEGKFADKNRALVLEVFNRGHIVGNHSYSHPANWLNLSYTGFEAEIVSTNEILTSITGEQVLYFAPPGGAFTDDTVQAAYDQGMYTILWSADSIDWRGEPANVLTNRVMSKIGPGGLILTHPKPETVNALPQIIEGIRSEGYVFTTVDKMIYGERISGN